MQAGCQTQTGQNRDRRTKVDGQIDGQRQRRTKTEGLTKADRQTDGQTHRRTKTEKRERERVFIIRVQSTSKIISEGKTSNRRQN